ncbi:MAG: MerR family transcriptional regulator [Gammaproteobacteria bacterium]|nr:MerR family transcriptional regulator [Gammaproteobacteria bacterium]
MRFLSIRGSGWECETVTDKPSTVIARIVEDDELTLAELCRVCAVPAEDVIELVEQGIIDPLGGETGRWRFRSVAIRRVRCAVQLHRDLGVNWAGAALALELLEELRALRQRAMPGTER